MAFEHYIRPGFIILSIMSEEKEDIIRELLEPIISAGMVRDEEKAYQDILEREKLCSTGLESGIAVPHAKTDQADNVSLVIGIHRKGVDFDSLDGKPTQLFFLIISSLQNAEDHLKLLSEIGKIAVNTEVCSDLLRSETVEDVLKIIQGM